MFVHVEAILLTPRLANRSSLSKDLGIVGLEAIIEVITHSYVAFGLGLYRSVISVNDKREPDLSVCYTAH